MKIISWNVNGLRSVYKKNFLESLKEIDPDIICLQEIKIQEDQIIEELLKIKNYNLYLNTATKKGYSGVAIYTKEKPLSAKTILGVERFDSEGRFLQLEFKNFILIGIYLPHGGRMKENLKYKLEVYDYFLKYLKKFKNKKIILIGDFNIAHSELDLANSKTNGNNIMFTPEEREQISKLISLDFVDTFRNFNKEERKYSWWPYRVGLRERNIGWRIDYVFVSKNLKDKVKKAFILNDILGSDHCPVGIEIK